MSDLEMFRTVESIVHPGKLVDIPRVWRFVDENDWSDVVEDGTSKIISIDKGLIEELYDLCDDELIDYEEEDIFDIEKFKYWLAQLGKLSVNVCHYYSNFNIDSVTFTIDLTEGFPKLSQTLILEDKTSTEFRFITIPIPVDDCLMFSEVIDKFVIFVNHRLSF